MTWVKLDDQMAEHEKVTRLSDSAFRVHVSALCYCARNLTDGKITQGAARQYGWSKRVRELVDARLWENASDGWVIHDYLKYNPSREEVEAERSKKRTAGQAGGKASAVARAQRSAQAEPQAESKPVPVPVPDPVPFLSVSDPPTPQRMTPEQIELSRYMRHLVHREVLKGVTAPDTDWNNDLIHRGAQQSDIDYASQQCIQRDIKDLGYFRTILERRVTEREAGVDHDQLARDRAQSAAREPHGRTSGSRGVARNGQGSGTNDDFGDAPPNSIRATDKPRGAEDVPGISSLESYRGGPRASGGAR